jgi:hypothetical protein
MKILIGDAHNLMLLVCLSNQPDYQKKHTTAKSTITKIFSTTNIENFKLTLCNLTWCTTTDSADVNDSYSHFWNDFTSKITEININGTLSSVESEIAKTFNQFFSTVGSTISDSIPPSTRDPLSHCPDFPDNLRQLELEGCGPMLVGNTIQTMVSKSSTDLDGISSKLLKSVRAEIERPLAHIFSLSLSSGIFPEQLKASRVIPIHKAWDTTNCDNYRPISLVNAFSKILEKIVCTKLVHHLESTNLMYKHQYRFLKGKSTEHALIQIMNTVGQALNENKYCVGIFLNLKKSL